MNQDETKTIKCILAYNLIDYLKSRFPESYAPGSENTPEAMYSFLVKSGYYFDGQNWRKSA